MCTLCKIEEETAEHLMMCKHPKVVNRYSTLYKVLKAKLNLPLVWFTCEKTGRELKDFPATLGSKGIIPESVYKQSFIVGKTPKETKDLVIAVQKEILDAHIDVWKFRNSLLYANKPKTGKYRDTG